MHDRIGVREAVVGDGALRGAVSAQEGDRLRRRAPGGIEFVREAELLGERGDRGAGDGARVGALGEPHADVGAVAKDLTGQDRVVEHGDLLS